jgi:hypothetical protein
MNTSNDAGFSVNILLGGIVTAFSEVEMFIDAKLPPQATRKGNIAISITIGRKRENSPIDLFFTLLFIISINLKIFIGYL